MKRITLVLLLAGFLGCETNEPVAPAPPSDGTVTINIGADLITPQYFKFDQKIGELQDCLGRFDLIRTQENFSCARQSWLDAHAVWEQTEAFMFGPVASAANSMHLDSFRVSVPDMHEIMETFAIISKKDIIHLNGTLKGFHAIEYFLWGLDGNKQLADFTPKEFEYMRAIIADMYDQSANIVWAWSPNRNDYNKHIRDAGQGQSDYASSKEVLRTMISAMIAACLDLRDRKLGGPLALGPEYEESHFSNSSATDYYNNLIGVQSVYLGGVEESGYSISALVMQKDYNVDQRIRQELTTAIQKIQNLGPSFRQTLIGNPSAVRDAQAAIDILIASLRNDVLTL